MRLLLAFLFFVAGAMSAYAQPAGQRFVSIVFHDVQDDRSNLGLDAITSRRLLEFFDWLKGSGWTAISLDDVVAAAQGKRALPQKSILLTFDDGDRSLYT